MLKVLFGIAVAAALVLAIAMRPVDASVGKSSVGWMAYPAGYQARIDKAIAHGECTYLERERRDAAGISDHSAEPALAKYIRDGMESADC